MIINRPQSDQIIPRPDLYCGLNHQKYSIKPDKNL